MPKKVKVDLDEVSEITLSRPQKKNALDEQLLMELDDAVSKVESSDVRVTILKGEGDTFCSGLDRNLLAKLADYEKSDLEEMIESVQNIISDINNLRMPTIATIERYAIGGGLQLSLAADIRIASPGTIFQVKEPDYGILPDMGALHFLPRMIGDGVAREIILTGREVTAEEGEKIGLVNRVSENPREEANEYIEKILSVPNPIALEKSKELIEESWNSNLEESLSDAKEKQISCIEELKG